MNTPIADFIKEYAQKNAVRAHMPGHKGVGGIERYDITEIAGADSLYEASGIIAKSEKNASDIFGCNTFYSTEGSSHCIRAMLCLAIMYAGRPITVLAGRNAHKSFVSACAFLGFQVEVDWIYGGSSYLTCDISAESLRVRFERGSIPHAVYITSPDYLGNMQDIAAISAVCREYGVLLLVDNAHGAYLKFLGRHPIDLGADIVCDSAHKTLPVLTGGAYLHVRDAEIAKKAKTALSFFGSTSPSYLILESLDRANAYLDGYADRLKSFLPAVEQLKCSVGLDTCGDEPMKITFVTKPYGYTGYEVAEYLEQRGIFCEFADPDHLVLMLTPENAGDIGRIREALISLERKTPISSLPPVLSMAERAMGLQAAMLSFSETVAVGECEGRIAAAVTVGCPPAVPIVVSGERINGGAVRAFEYYGIDKIEVVKE